MGLPRPFARQREPATEQVGPQTGHADARAVAKLVRAAEDTDPVMAAAVALGFVTGARRGELCALKWSDVDLDRGAIRIERSITQAGDNVTVKSTKTGRGRTFSFDARTVALLLAHRSWQEHLAADVRRIRLPRATGIGSARTATAGPSTTGLLFL